MSRLRHWILRLWRINKAQCWGGPLDGEWLNARRLEYFAWMDAHGRWHASPTPRLSRRTGQYVFEGGNHFRYYAPHAVWPPARSIA